MEDSKQFMYAVKTVGHPEHEQNRLLFANTFSGKEDQVKAFFYEKRKEEAGRNFRPIKDVRHEERILSYRRIMTNREAYEHRTLCDLMRAKWSAIGYYKDAEYKQRFIDEYCVAIE